MANKTHFDFLIIGAGIIGLAVALELKNKYPTCSVGILEKEKDCGQHTSGRNSGVLHAGFYYTSNSLKARFSQQGNQYLTEYCKEKKIPINCCGKLVVAKNHIEASYLDELMKRAETNGVILHKISAKEATKIESRVKTFEYALFSPSTSSVDPVDIIQALKEDAIQRGILIFREVKYLTKTKEGIQTSLGEFFYGYLINAAGLYADKVGKDFGFGLKYRILPFKGLYLYSNEPPNSLRTHVYPVPDLQQPFLGVHFTISSKGAVKIGPTAIPALWREQYTFSDSFKASEFADIILRQTSLFFSSGFDFKKLAWNEIQKHSKRKMVQLASSLLHGVEVHNYTRWGKPGIRAQLLDIQTKKLEMDFVLEGDSKSLHILNAVSPGFTCSFPFARYIINKIEEWMAK